MPWEAEERQQLWQVALQLPHQGTIHRLPAAAKSTKSGFGLTTAIGERDRLGIGFHRARVATAYLLQDIPHLVHPATLMQCPGVHGLDGRGQPRTAVGDDQQQLLAFQPAAIQILEQTFPGALAFALTAQKAQQLPGAVGAYPIGHQHVYPLPSAGPAHPQTDAVQKQVRPFVLQRRLLKLPHRLVQIARQAGHGLRTDRLARHDRHQPPHLPGRDPPQKSFPDQQRDFFGPALKLLQHRRQKTALASAGDAQTQGPEAGHEIALVIAVTIVPTRLLPAVARAHPEIALPLRQQLERRRMLCCTCPCRSPQKLSFSSLTKCWTCSVMGVTFAMGVSLLSRTAFACEAKSQLTPSRFLHNRSYVTQDQRHYGSGDSAPGDWSRLRNLLPSRW